MLQFLRRYRIILASGFLLVFSLLLLSSSARTGSRSDPLAGLLLEAMRPLQVTVTRGLTAAASIWQRYIDLVGVREQSERLRNRLLDLEQLTGRLNELEDTNRRLRELLDLRETLGGPTISARVSGRDPATLSRGLTIDKGFSDGIGKGAAVLSPSGVVGRVVTVSPHAARVLLLTDNSSGIDAIVQRSRARGIITGALTEGCLMKYLKRGEDVVVGDRVLTSGLDGIFPKGILIGEIVEVTHKNQGLLQIAKIQPSALLDHLEEVLVVASGAATPTSSEPNAGQF